MSFKYSKGAQVIGDLKAQDDTQRDTQIDFGEDYIGFETSGSAVMVVSGSAVGIGTTTPDYTLDVAGNIGVDQYIYHNGDADTNINFTDDRIRFKAGGMGFIGMHKKSSSPHQVTINNGNNNIDFVVNSNNNSNDPVLRCDASAASVGIRTASPIAELDVAGKIAITAESSTPSQPSDGQGYLYTKSDGKIYWRSYDVSETDLTDGGGGSTNAAGSDGQLQYNNGGTNFGGAAQLYYDDSNNRLGIGISAPDQSLHVQDGNILLQHNAANNFSTELQFTKSRHATDGSQTVVQSGDILGEIVFKGSDGDEFVTAAAITAKVGHSSPGNNDMPGKIVFSTTQDGAASLTEAVRIDEGQNVILENGAVIVKSHAAGATIGEGTNSWQGAAFDSYATAYNSKRGARIISRGDTGTTNRGTFVLKLEKHDAGSGLEAIQIDANGNVKVTGGSVGSVSDSRVKENIVTLDSALDKVKQLNPVKFDWADPIRNTDSDRTSNSDFGFIAQEMESVYPDVVYTGPKTDDEMPDNLKTISYSSIIAILTKAVQEQQEQIDELKVQVAALQN